MNIDNDIPKGWRTNRIGEVCTIYVGKDVKQINFSETLTVTHKYPIYSNTVENYGLYGFYDFEEYKGETVTVVGRGVGLGTAFARTDSYGAIGRLLVLYPNERVNFKYLAEYINSRINILVESAAIPQLTGEQVATYKLLIPPLPEQQKIASILSVWDEAIEKQTKLIEKLELRKKGLMQQLLSGKKRLADYKSKFRKAKMSDLFQRITRKNTEGNSTVVTISAQRGFVIQTDFFNKKVASDSLDNYFLIHKGEFCYNKSYSNGYPMGVIKRLNTFDKAVVTTLYICFSITDNNKIDSNFIQHYFEAGLLNKELVKVANEGGRAHGLLNVIPSDFFSLELIIPEYEEQKAISKVLDEMNLVLTKSKTRLERMKNQKKALMQQLLTGKTRVKL